jgi:hypothetical protein
MAFRELKLAVPAEDSGELEMRNYAFVPYYSTTVIVFRRDNVKFPKTIIVAACLCN